MSRLPGTLGDVCQRFSEASPTQESKVILWIKPTLNTLSKSRESFSAHPQTLGFGYRYCVHICVHVCGLLCVFLGRSFKIFLQKYL